MLSGDEAMFEAAERDGSSLDPSPWRLVVAGSSGRNLGVMNENILASVQCLVSSVQRYQDSTAIHYIQHHHCTHCPGVTVSLQSPYSLLTIAYIQTSNVHAARKIT